MSMSESSASDARKARGAFFTPAPIARFIVDWAVRRAGDSVLDPSCGDAAFLAPAATKLLELSSVRQVAACVRKPATGEVCARKEKEIRGEGPVGEKSAGREAEVSEAVPREIRVDGVDVDPPSAAAARERVGALGVRAHVQVTDFFTVPAEARYDVVVGNPPYVRYQGFAGTSRTAGREAALRAGVSLTALASSWAPFVVHACQFLVRGGRLGFVLPAELLSVNYAAPVRRFLFDSFSGIELVLFESRVFDEAQADVVLLLAEGYGGSTSHAAVRQVRDERDLAAASSLARAARGERTWAPASPEAKWTELLAPAAALAALDELRDSSALTPLSEWGAVKLGAVTGNNGYFTLSPSRARELGLDRRDLLRISPAGSSHLRGLSLTSRALAALGEEGRGTLLFRPRTPLSAAARHYIRAGSETGVDLAYKCRARDPWYIVPLTAVPDLFLTAMNAEMPRLAANSARVRHLNSVHGVCLAEELRRLGTELLPLACLNSASRLSAELSGRSYGGGILKLEPGEARGWLVPSPTLISERLEELRSIKTSVARALRRGELSRATEMVDAALGLASAKPGSPGSGGLFAAAAALSRRRMDRGRKRGR